MMNKLMRLKAIAHEAKEIVRQLEEHANGKIIAYCPDITLDELLEGSTKQVRFCNTARKKGVYNVRDLLAYSQKQVFRWRNVGNGCVKEVAERLNERYGIIWE